MAAAVTRDEISDAILVGARLTREAARRVAKDGLSVAAEMRLRRQAAILEAASKMIVAKMPTLS